MYYAGDFVPDANRLPTCWSLDTRYPAPEVVESEKQSAVCLNCTQNIRGSARGGSGRACRYFQYLAVVPMDDLKTVYRLQVPAASIFGKANNNRMSLGAYSQFLAKHGTSSFAVVTRIFFDNTYVMPKLCFAAERALEEEELVVARQMIDHQDSLEAITFRLPAVNKSPFSVTEGFVFNNGDK